MLTRHLNRPKAEHALMFLARASRGRISYAKAAHLLYVAERNMACQHHSVLADMNLLTTRDGLIAAYALTKAREEGLRPEDEFAWTGPSEALDQLSVSDERALEAAFMTYGQLELGDIRRQLKSSCPEWRMPLDPFEEISHREMLMGVGLPRSEADEVEAIMIEHAGIDRMLDDMPREPA